MLAAVRAGADILRGGGSALDAVVATVRALEDHPLFNAGVGSLLTAEGTVEMDAGVMVATPVSREGGRRAAVRGARPRAELQGGAVGAVSRVRNPILLARAVMEHTPHLLMVGSGAERFARRAGADLCRPAELVTERARERWRAAQADRASAGRAAAVPGLGTVGAAAVDSRGILAAATSTGGVSGKLPGRLGDSAILGAGVFADLLGAASATGQGEAIMKVALCREAIDALSHSDPQNVARQTIADCAARTDGKAGVIIVDKRGRLGFAHNAEVMDVATFDAKNGVTYRWVEPLREARHERSTRRS